MTGPAVPAQLSVPSAALPIAAHNSGPPNSRDSKPAIAAPVEPVPEEPAVVTTPADPVVRLLESVLDPVPGSTAISAVAVPVAPVSRVAPAKAAITAERITNSVSF